MSIKVKHKIRVYADTGSTPIVDPDRLLNRAQEIRFLTTYPGGIFEACSFFIPCDPTRYRPIKHMQRLQIKSGLKTVWEGYITSITIVVMPGRKGLEVQATGAWALAYKRFKYNRWIDRRFSSNIYGVWNWEWDFSSNQNEKIDVNTTDQLLLKPKSVEWALYDRAYVFYRTNGSSNVKRIVFDYTLSETIEFNPVRAKKFTTIGATYTANLTNLIDGNATTTQAVQLASNDLLYIGIPIDKAAGITGFRFDFDSTVNNNAATLTLEYFTNGHTWQSIAITDGTASGGAPWAVDGSVTFTEIDGLHWVEINGSQEFIYFRFGASGALDNVVIKDIFVQRAQSWKLILYDHTNSTELWSTTTAGSGSQDITLGTSAGTLSFSIRSEAAQAVVGDDIYGRITNLALVAEAWDGPANTTVTTLLEDMVHYIGGPFADDYTFIASNTYDLLSTGFVADDLLMSLAEQMDFVGNINATDVAYSVGALESDSIGGTNISPVIYYEAVPLLTDYDYAVRLDEGNLDGVELVLSAETDTLINRVFVKFTTPNNQEDWSNVLSYAGLSNADSQSKYYQRTLVVDGGEAATKALAGPVGAVYINNQSGLQYYVRNPLQLKGTIRTKGGRSVPVSHVRAGTRIKIENFVEDVGDITGGLTFLISGTDYDDTTGVLSVYTSVPDDMARYLAAQPRG